GHIATALGAANLIATKKHFNGTVRFIFQPAEEHGKGALSMLNDGLLEKFPIDEIYGLHNIPHLPEGEIHSKVGGIMGREDNFKIHIKVKGGHASSPHMGVDPFVIASQIILALQTIASRNVDSSDTALRSRTDLQSAGLIYAIPTNVVITGDCRTSTSKTHSLLKQRREAICESICSSNEATYEYTYKNS